MRPMQRLLCPSFSGAAVTNPLETRLLIELWTSFLQSSIVRRGIGDRVLSLVTLTRDA